MTLYSSIVICTIRDTLIILVVYILLDCVCEAHAMLRHEPRYTSFVPAGVVGCQLSTPIRVSCLGFFLNEI